MDILSTAVNINVKLDGDSFRMKPFKGSFVEVGREIVDYAAHSKHEKIELQLIEPNDLNISEDELRGIAARLNVGSAFLLVNLGLIESYERLVDLGFQHLED